MRKRMIGFILGLVIVIGAGVVLTTFRKPDCSQLSPGQPAEVEVIPIPMAGPLKQRSAEISGMDWYGEYLIILPQYLDHADGRVMYAIPKSEILKALQEPSAPPIEPIRIPVEDQMFGDKDVKDFEGYEAIAFIENQLYLTVEVSSDDGMVGYLISGEIEPDLSRIVLDVDGRQSIPLPQDIDNLTDEAILAVGDQLVTIFEANGAVVNPSPAAQVFDRNLNLARNISFPVMEYRVTDATRLDSSGNFWVLNTFTLGTYDLDPAEDQIAQQFGEGCTHSYYHWVERLVELHYEPETGITLSETPPIQLALQGTVLSRNWEAVVRLDDQGFLIASDKYPKTILGFVPLP